MLLAKMDWQQAAAKLGTIVKRYPGMESAWSQLGGVKTELGKSKDADRCFAIALEIAPEHELFQTRAIERLQHKLPFADLMKKADSIVQNFRWSPRIQFPLSMLLSRSGNGLEYERSLKECIKCFPRNSQTYHQLAGWYTVQNRADLARRIMRDGRSLMGEEELPVADFEKTAAERKAAESNASDSADDAPKPSSNKPKSLFQQHQSKLRQEAESKPWSEFQTLPELKQLKSAAANHKLTWIQTAEVLACEVGNLIGDIDGQFRKDAASKAETLKSILPSHVPGIGEQFVGYLFDEVNFAGEPLPVLDVAVAWFENMAPESHKYPDVQFEKSLLFEYRSQLNDAEAILNQIIDEHPCYVIAWYRLGQLYSQRNEQSRAFEMFEKCVELQPGYMGPLSELIQLAPNVAPDKAETYADAMANYLPYSQQYVYEAAIRKSSENDYSRGIEFIDTRRELLGDSKYAATKARFLADIGQYDAAIEILADAKIDSDDDFVTNWVRVDCFVSKEDFEQATQWLDRLEESAPDDETVIDQKVRLLRLKSPEEARAYSIAKIESGNPLPILAHVALADVDNPIKFMKETLANAPEKNRDAIATCFYEATLQLEDPRYTGPFLEFCRKEMPHLTALRETLVYHHGMSGATAKSEQVARELFDAEPENTRWMSLLGWAIQDKKPAESIKLLQQEFEITNSVETLARLARGYQLNREKNQARETWLAVLARNPNHVLALTNLNYEFKVNDASIADKFVDTIEKQLVHPSDQYFLAQAIKIAKQHKIQLPVGWISLAVQRVEQLAVESPFLDEASLLKRGIYLWFNRWEIKELPVKVGFADRLKAKWVWPRSNWVPDQPN